MFLKIIEQERFLIMSFLSFCGLWPCLLLPPYFPLFSFFMAEIDFLSAAAAAAAAGSDQGEGGGRD